KCELIGTVLSLFQYKNFLQIFENNLQLYCNYFHVIVIIYLPSFSFSIKKLKTNKIKYYIKKFFYQFYLFQTFNIIFLGIIFILFYNISVRLREIHLSTITNL